MAVTSGVFAAEDLRLEELAVDPSGDDDVSHGGELVVELLHHLVRGGDRDVHVARYILDPKEHLLFHRPFSFAFRRREAKPCRAALALHGGLLPEDHPHRSTPFLASMAFWK